MKRPIIIVAALIVSLVAFWFYTKLLPHAGIEPMGDETDVTALWLALATGCVSLLTAMIGLIQKAIELRANKVS